MGKALNSIANLYVIDDNSLMTQFRNGNNVFEDMPKQNPNMTYQYEGSNGLMMGGN